MSVKSKEQLSLQTEEATDRRELYLREGRTLTVESSGTEELVEVRSASGHVEVRIRLTEDGPVLQMESARLQLKASETVEIASKKVQIRASESVELKSDSEITAEAEGDVRVNGSKIWLN